MLKKIEMEIIIYLWVKGQLLVYLRNNAVHNFSDYMSDYNNHVLFLSKSSRETTGQNEHLYITITANRCTLLTL